jgi:hypothetical protein
MGWRLCSNCFADCSELDIEFDTDTNVCRECWLYLRYRQRLRDFCDAPFYVYAWVELDNERDQNEIDTFYIGRGTKRRLLATTDRNDYAVAYRAKLERWRSFRLKILAECDDVECSINYEWAMIEHFRPRCNLDFSRRIK